MLEKIYAKKSTLFLEIPLRTKRFNPYMEEYVGEMDNIIAIVENDHDMGFCYRIDMEYKGKDDQWTDYFYKFHGSPEEFEKICKKLKVDIVYYHSPLK